MKRDLENSITNYNESVLTVHQVSRKGASLAPSEPHAFVHPRFCSPTSLNVNFYYHAHIPRYLLSFGEKETPKSVSASTKACVERRGRKVRAFLRSEAAGLAKRKGYCRLLFSMPSSPAALPTFALHVPIACHATGRVHVPAVQRGHEAGKGVQDHRGVQDEGRGRSHDAGDESCTCIS